MKRLYACSQEKLRCPKVEMESYVQAVDLERCETRPAFPFAFGRHAQNTVLIVSPPG